MSDTLQQIDASVGLLALIQEGFTKIYTASLGDRVDGAIQGQVHAILEMLGARLRRNWHQLALLDHEADGAVTFQQEIWNSVKSWAGSRDPLNPTQFVRALSPPPELSPLTVASLAELGVQDYHGAYCKAASGSRFLWQADDGL